MIYREYSADVKEFINKHNDNDTSCYVLLKSRTNSMTKDRQYLIAVKDPYKILDRIEVIELKNKL